MIIRWFGSVATLIGAAAMAAAQAPTPASWLPSNSPVPAPTTNYQNQSSPVGQPKSAPSADVKPAAAVAQTVQPVSPSAMPALIPPGQTVNPMPAVGPPANINDVPASGVSFDDVAHPAWHVWARTEYILWNIKDTPLPTILGTIPNSDARLGQLPPNAIQPVFGGGNLDYDAQNGLRLTLGVALDRSGDWAIETQYFQLERAAQGASLTSNGKGSPAGGPVFNDPVADKQTVILYSDPGLAGDGGEFVRNGNVNDFVQNRLWGIEMDVRRRLTSIFGDRLDLIVGYRHIGFDESLEDNGTSTRLADVPGPAHVVSYDDQFGMHNNFDGAQIGLDAEYDIGRCCFVNLCGKVGLGNTNETYSINGTTNFVSNVPGVPSQQFNGGVLAQPSNIGAFERNRVCFLGEITANAGVRLFDDHVKAFVGYNFLGLSKVARVDDIIDGVDGSGVPSLKGDARNMTAVIPGQKIDDGRFWAQGLNLGLQFEY